MAPGWGRGVNIRASTVLGVVDAGGAGQRLKYAVDLLDFARVLAILIMVVALVLAAYRISARCGRRCCNHGGPQRARPGPCSAPGTRRCRAQFSFACTSPALPGASPTADRRPPTADRRPPTAAWRWMRPG